MISNQKASNIAIDKGLNIYNNPTYKNITLNLIGEERSVSSLWNIGAY